jgi:hypothetical protein
MKKNIISKMGKILISLNVIPSASLLLLDKELIIVFLIINNLIQSE